MRDLYRAMPTFMLATVALVVAASGTAGALAGKGSVDKDDLQKNVVTTKNVKNGSLKGADLKKDSLTGKQVKESSLATVPNAASVDSVKFFDVTLVEGQSKTLLTKASLSLVGTCADNAGSTVLTVLVASTVAGATFAGDDESGLVGPATLVDDRDIESLSDTAGSGPDVSDGYDDAFWMHSAAGGIVVGTVGQVADADTNSCQFFGATPPSSRHGPPPPAAIIALAAGRPRTGHGRRPFRAVPPGGRSGLASDAADSRVASGALSRAGGRA